MSQVELHYKQLQTWWQGLVKLDPDRYERGFLGSIPYVLVLRYLIQGAVMLRFWLHKTEYTNVELGSRVLLCTMITIATLSATYITLFKPGFRNNTYLQLFFIIVDITTISTAYLLTNNPESDFFLFYYLPIFATVEYLEWETTATVCFVVGMAMLFVVFSMHPAPQPAWTHSAFIWRVLIPRGSFLFIVALNSAYAFRILSRRQAELKVVLDSFHASSAAMLHIQELDTVLETVLSEVIEQLGFEFAAISLVDEFRRCIETVRGRNISPGWVKRAKHALSAVDIQTHIVKTGQFKIIEGPDNLLDQEIYERFEHWRLARIWVPIISIDNEVVGTIEAGCNRERRQEILRPEVVDRLLQLGLRRGEQISRNRPHVLLKGVTRHALRLIRADSGTLHVYRRNTDPTHPRDKEWGELILAAGAGRANPDFVESIPPRAKGRARSTIGGRKPEWIDDPRLFRAEYPRLHSFGMRALAVIPLELGPEMQGLLSIHFWRKKRITPREIHLAETFAHEMEGVIRNYLLLQRATEVSSSAWALSGLQSLMQSLNSPFSLPDVLQKIARNALLTLDAANVTLYRFEAETASFFLPPVMDGDFMDPAAIQMNLLQSRKLFSLKQDGVSVYLPDVHAHPFLAAPGDSSMSAFVNREKITSSAVLLLRPGDSYDFAGIMFVNFRDFHDFSTEEKRAMDALAVSAALAIRTAKLHKGDLSRQLRAMRQVHAAIAEKGPDLPDVIERLLHQIVDLTGALHGVCMQYQEHTESLAPLARWPTPGSFDIRPQSIEDGIIGVAARSKRTILVEDVEDANRTIFVETVGEIYPAKHYRKVNPTTRSEIAVPLVDQGRLLGVLNVENDKPGAFTQEHRALLETLAVPAIVAFHTVDLYEQLGRRVAHLRALNIIAGHIQSSPFELDVLARLFLTGVTAKSGLSFSRAMLFLAEDGSRRLRGYSAVGATTIEHAERIWRDKSLSTDLETLLCQAERAVEDTKRNLTSAQYLLDEKIRDVVILIEDAHGTIPKCVKSGRCEVVPNDDSDTVRSIILSVTESSNHRHGIACVPVVAQKKELLGLLVVDNKFLAEEREIKEEDIAGLEAFAGFLAMSIKNVQLRDDLDEKKRIENWKEATGFIAHSVGTMLFEVKGHFRELRAHIDSDNLIFEELNAGISRAEKMLYDFRLFASPKPLTLDPLDINRVLREVFKPNQLDCAGELSSSVLLVLGDEAKLDKAFREIRKNALEAMAGNTNRRHLITVESVLEQSETDTFARIVITDNGPGIPNDQTAEVFRMANSTKPDGTGLGLAIVKSVIESHGGTIEAGNCEGAGARFTIKLPIVNSNEVFERGAYD